MPTLGNALDFAKYEGRNLRAHQLAAAPGSPVTGQLFYNTADNTLYWWDGTAWVSARGGVTTPPDATASVKGVVQLAGDLAGTAASPQIAAGVITDAEVAAANKDGAAGTAGMRSLGTGAQQAAAGNHRLDQHSLPTTTVDMNGQRLLGVGAPVAGGDATNKGYVDGLVQGLDAKQSVRAIATSTITLSGTQTIDGVALNVGDRVIVAAQASPAPHGIYVVAAGAWTRAPDMDAWSEVPGAFAFVEEGTLYKDTGWVAIADQGGTLGTTGIDWVQFSAAGQIVDGAGLLKTGTTLDVRVDNSSIEINADLLRVKAAGITNAMLAGLIDLSSKMTGVLPLANGGTGSSSLASVSRYYSSATHGAGATITITQATHGLRASRGLVVQVQDEATGAVEFPDVVVAASGDVTVTYGASVSANSKRVTVLG